MSSALDDPVVVPRCVACIYGTVAPRWLIRCRSFCRAKAAVQTEGVPFKKRERPLGNGEGRAKPPCGPRKSPEACRWSAVLPCRRGGGA
jgi:hypothetical protein